MRKRRAPHFYFCAVIFLINLHLECIDLHYFITACLPYIALQTHFIAEKTEVSTVSPPASTGTQVASASNSFFLRSL